jgi:hypothetical protein
MNIPIPLVVLIDDDVATERDEKTCEIGFNIAAPDHSMQTFDQS